MEVDLLYVTTFVTIIGLLYYLLTKNNGYFHDKPIPSMAVYPLLGSSAPLMLKRVTFPNFVKLIYDKYPSARVFGFFDTTTPIFVIRDPELIKRIAVKDFDHFVDHRPMFGHVDMDGDDSHKLFAKSLFAMTGQRWREMRATLSPAFTGSKMRQMFGLMVEGCETLMQYLEDQTNAKGSTVEIEVKDVLSRLGIDVIATCAFGLKVNSLKEPENEFYRQGRRIVNFSGFGFILKIASMRFFPKLTTMLGIDVVDREQADYFTKLIRDTMSTREGQGIVRHDMIDLLIQAKKNTLSHQEESESQDGFATVEESNVGKVQLSRPMTESEMVAQCLIFFVAGFEAVSTTALFAVYELVRHPEIQDRLYQEVLQTKESLQGKQISYDVLQQMKYLDMVVSETLRIWAPSTATDRLCVRDYELDAGDGLRFTIDKGTCVWFPVYGLHHDPKYYPNPERFDPERFNDENKRNINLGAYLPFGSGPRNCIGSRFALMEIKAILYHMLLKFSFEQSENTQIPLQLEKGLSNLATERGLHVNLRLRSDVK
ncbi:hypothetical protein quinque_007019 [Culex quinquefasciatus]|nr:cytochrome P450 9e2 [Culex quinquefasciatus]